MLQFFIFGDKEVALNVGTRVPLEAELTGEEASVVLLPKWYLELCSQSGNRGIHDLPFFYFLFFLFIFMPLYFLYISSGSLAQKTKFVQFPVFRTISLLTARDRSWKIIGRDKKA